MHTTVPSGFHLGYRPWLDGLRGVAVLMVLAGHLQLVKGGFLGVDVFFVLSGFLITSLLVEEWQQRGSISLKRFYLRRGLRLLPAFFAVLLACLLYVHLFRPPEEATAYHKEMLVAGLYVANCPSIQQTPLPTLGHTWSLSLEEQFYLIWPLLLYGLLRLGLARWHVILLVAGGILASAGLRFWLFSRIRFGPEWVASVARLYAGLDTRADALLVGCLVGLLAAWNLIPKSRLFLLGTGVAALGSGLGLAQLFRTGTMGDPLLYKGLFTIVALLVGVIIARLLLSRSVLWSWILESRILVGVGRISYALYLVHIPIIRWLEPPGFGWEYPAVTLQVVGLSLAAAWLSYYCIERRCLRLKSRFEVAGTPLPTVAQPDSPYASPPRVAA